MKFTIAYAAALVASASAQLYPLTSSENHTCAIQPAYRSCSAKAVPDSVDTCCVETFGGLVLLTQFWNTWSENTLPKNEFTLHGLWPDFCNGSYTQYCDLSRQYDPVPGPNTTNGLPNGTVVPPYNGSDIGTFLEPFGVSDLIKWMNTHWIAQRGPNHALWAHEFSKHATCFSTFDIPCYGPEYVKHQEVLSFFETTIKYFRQFTTWEWLSQHGIQPSNSTSYTKADLEDALTQEFGAVPYLGCSGPRFNETEAGRQANTTDTGRTVLSEVWYYMHVYGRPQDGHYVPTDQTTISSCTNATGGVWYYEPGPQ